MYFGDSDGGTEQGDGGSECSCGDVEGGLGDTEGGCGDRKRTCLAVRARSRSCAMRFGAVISASLASIAVRWAITRSSMLAEIAREGVPLTITPPSELYRPDAMCWKEIESNSAARIWRGALGFAWWKSAMASGAFVTKVAASQESWLVL